MAKISSAFVHLSSSFVVPEKTLLSMFGRTLHIAIVVVTPFNFSSGGIMPTFPGARDLSDNRDANK